MDELHPRRPRIARGVPSEGRWESGGRWLMSLFCLATVACCGGDETPVLPSACTAVPRGASPTVTCASDEILPPQTLDLQAAIDTAIRGGASTLLLPRGEYRVPVTLVIRSPRNMVIDGQGARLVFTNAVTNPDSRGILIDDAHGLTLRNLSLDYDPLPFTQGRVVATEQGAAESTFDVEIDQGYRSDLPFFADSVAYTELSIRPFEPTTRRIKRDGLRLIVSRVDSPATGVLRFATTDASVSLTNIAVGDLVATAAFRSSTIYVLDSEGTVFDNVTVHTANGTSIEEVGGGGGTDARVCFRPGGLPPGATAPRLLAGARGGFNSRGVGRGPNIHDSIMERMGDDAIAISGAVYEIPAISGDTINLPAPDPSLPIAIPPGSPIEIYDGETLAIRVTTTVTAVTPQSITLADARGVVAGDGLVFLGRASVNPIVRNTLIRDGDARGMMIETSGALIENNTVENTYFAGIYLALEFGFYTGGPAPRDTIVRGNILRDVAVGRQAQAGYGGIMTFTESKDRSKVINSQPMRNILFESNSVSGSGGWGLAITNASDVRVINMVLEGTNSIQQLPPRTIIGPTPAAAVLVDDARDVSFTGSWVTGQGPFGTE